MRKIITILLFAVLAVSCNKEEDIITEPQLPVTFTNTAGDWVLVFWKNNPVEEGTVELHLKNKEFILRQNVGSMYPVEYTGSYNLIEEDGVGTVIRGFYDYTYEYWEHRYIISSLTSGAMEWTSQDDEDDVYVYVRKVSE